MLLSLISVEQNRRRVLKKLKFGLDYKNYLSGDSEDGVTDQLEINKSLALCSVCGLNLAKLYGAVKAFQELSFACSYLELLNQKLVSGFESGLSRMSGTSQNASQPSLTSVSDDDVGMEYPGDDNPDYNNPYSEDDQNVKQCSPEAVASAVPSSPIPLHGKHLHT